MSQNCNWIFKFLPFYSLPASQQRITANPDILEVCKNTLDMISKEIYKEPSLQARIERLKETSSTLQGFSQQINAQKKWYECVLNFFGVGLTDQEKTLKKTIAKVNGIIAQFQTLQAKNRVGHKCFGFFLDRIGLNSRERRIRQIELAGVQEQITQCAFRCLGDLIPAERKIIDRRLEGSAQDASFFHVINDLREFLKQCSGNLTAEERHRVEEAIQLLEEGLSLTLKSWELRYAGHCIEPCLTDIAYTLQKKCQSLDVGKKMIIPGGYRGKDRAHAVLFEIFRASRTEYIFSLHNTGEGATRSSVANAVLWIFTGHLCGLKIKQLSIEDISERRFLLDLIRPNFVILPNFSTENIYRLIEERLEPKGVKKTSEGLYETQTWGTCAFDSIMLFLRFSMPQHLFDLFYDFIRKKAQKKLLALLPKAEKEGLFNPATLELLKKKALQSEERSEEYLDYLEERNKIASQFHATLKEAAKGGNGINEATLTPILKEYQKVMSEKFPGFAPHLD